MKLRMLVAALGVAGLLACNASEDDTTIAEDPADLVAGKKAALDPQAKRDLYHASEGSEFFPYFAVRAAKLAILDDGTVSYDGIVPSGKRGEVVSFLDPKNLARYGLLPDAVSKEPMGDGRPANPEGLPIGITLARAEDTGFISMGVNCAVCHVGEVQYKTKSGALAKLRVDGAPNMFDIRNFYGDLVRSLMAQVKQPSFRTAASTSALHVATLYDSIYGVDKGFFGNAQRFLEQLDLLLDLAELAKKAIEAKAAGKQITPADAEAALETLKVSPRQKRLLFARFMFFTTLLGRKAGVPGGPGRTDAFGVAKNSLFAHIGWNQPTNAQVSYPNMFNMETEAWFHYNSNTTSVIERNIGQSIGLGAVADLYPSANGGAPTFEHTANVHNLNRLEKAIYKIAPPVFPDNGIKDQEKAKAGRAVYLKRCQSCHEPTPITKAGQVTNPGNADLFASGEIPFAEIGVDRNQADNFDADIFGKPLNERIGTLLGTLRTKYYNDHKVSAAEQADFENKKHRQTSEWRNTPRGQSGDKIIKAKPLDGVWATAPFLHNGSVPTLRDLLKPAAQRPKKFRVGHRLYDTKNVGYVVLDEKGVPVDAEVAKTFTQAELDQARREATFVLDTAATKDGLVSGDTNIGHEVGTDLSDADKDALIEFLKGFGGGRARPMVYPPGQTE